VLLCGSKISIRKIVSALELAAKNGVPYDGAMAVLELSVDLHGLCVTVGGGRLRPLEAAAVLLLLRWWQQLTRAVASEVLKNVLKHASKKNCT